MTYGERHLSREENENCPDAANETCSKFAYRKRESFLKVALPRVVTTARHTGAKVHMPLGILFSHVRDHPEQLRLSNKIRHLECTLKPGIHHLSQLD